jgi:hypothetical protein
MAMGVPVVTSRIAAGGVDAEPVTHFLVADSAEEYSDAILGSWRIQPNGSDSRLPAGSAC